MKLTDEPALSALAALHSICNDSQEGYEHAANDANDPELKRIFNDYAVQRMKFVEEIHDRIKVLRGDLKMDGSLGGDLHRAWMDVRAASSSAQNHTVLVECERAEDMAVKAYGEALNVRDLDDATRKLVQRQYESVQAAHDRIRQLRDSATYAYR